MNARLVPAALVFLGILMVVLAVMVRLPGESLDVVRLLIGFAVIVYAVVLWRKPGSAERKLQRASVWLPFAYSVMLSAIWWSADKRLSAIGASDTGFLAGFILNLPMAFFFVAESHRQTRGYIESLEARVRQLEAERGAGPH